MAKKSIPAESGSDQAASGKDLRTLRRDALNEARLKLSRCRAVADLLCAAKDLCETTIEEETIDGLPWMLWDLIAEVDEAIGRPEVWA